MPAAIADVHQATRGLVRSRYFLDGSVALSDFRVKNVQLTHYWFEGCSHGGGNCFVALFDKLSQIMSVGRPLSCDDADLR